MFRHYDFRRDTKNQKPYLNPLNFLKTSKYIELLTLKILDSKYNHGENWIELASEAFEFQKSGGKLIINRAPAGEARATFG
jgi:hypothetical protein